MFNLMLVVMSLLLCCDSSLLFVSAMDSGSSSPKLGSSPSSRMKDIKDFFCPPPCPKGKYSSCSSCQAPSSYEGCQLANWKRYSKQIEESPLTHHYDIINGDESPILKHMFPLSIEVNDFDKNTAFHLANYDSRQSDVLLYSHKYSVASIEIRNVPYV
jgi:hypothetical protein